MKVSDDASSVQPTSRHGRRLACGACLVAAPAVVVVALWLAEVPLNVTRAHVGMCLSCCGDPPAPLDDLKFNVLVIGDSISMEYTPLVAERLADVAVVQSGGGLETNGGNTRKGLRCLDRWLGNGTWDVVHFNHGLWDMVDREHTRWWPAFPARKRKTWTEQQSVPVDEYAANVRTYYERLRNRSRVVVFATTTPVPGCTPKCTPKHKRSPRKVLDYNAAALAALPRDAVVVDDVYAAAVGYCGEPFPNAGCAEVPLLRKGDIHFKAKGYEALAVNISRAIRGALPPLLEEPP